MQRVLALAGTAYDKTEVAPEGEAVALRLRRQTAEDEKGEEPVLTKLPGIQQSVVQQRLDLPGYDVSLPPRRPVELPPIPPPPIPPQHQPPSTCPTQEVARERIRSAGVAGRTEQAMRYQVNLERSRAAYHRPIPLTHALIRRADRAIRASFGDVLPAGRNFAAPNVIAVSTPEALVRARIPDAQHARERIAEVALRAEEDRLRLLCVTQPGDPVLQDEVAIPTFNRVGLDFVREYDSASVGGQTTHTPTGGAWSRHVEIPNEHRHMGHIVMHEAMHYYVDDTYFRTASGHALERELLEGGAEYLTRQVIYNQLADDPAFRINDSVYADEHAYVLHSLRAGLSSFPLVYFGGRVDLIGLTPRSVP